MAAGETPAPAFDYAGGSLPHGQEDALAHIQQADNAYVQQFGSDTAVPEQEFQPANSAEQFLASPTDRPQEPLTQGAPFGPGANFTPFAYESDRNFLMRVTSDLAAQGDAQVSEFAARVQRGE